jgi:hypothetical protein
VRVKNKREREREPIILRKKRRADNRREWRKRNVIFLSSRPPLKETSKENTCNQIYERK